MLKFHIGMLSESYRRPLRWYQMTLHTLDIDGGCEVQREGTGLLRKHNPKISRHQGQGSPLGDSLPQPIRAPPLDVKDPQKQRGLANSFGWAART